MEPVQSDVVQTKIVSILDALQNGAVEIGHQVVKYSPNVVNAALKVTQIDAIQNLISGSFFLVSGLLVLWVLYHGFSHLNNYPDSPLYFIILLGGTIYEIIAVIGVCSCLFDVWNWVALFEPKLYIAHQIVEKVLQ